MPVFFLPENACGFPDPAHAREDGLLAVGGNLSATLLVEAYALGVFPWYGEHSPILWWSPQPRCILRPERLHVPKSLQKILKRNLFSFSFDRAFSDVITACATTRSTEGSWLVPDMIAAYVKLHELGVAHSVEVWHEGQLAGGLYGICLGKAFFGESMFFSVPNASKAALVFLATTLKEKEFCVVDCQQTTAHMLRFGAEEVDRDEFMALLDQAYSYQTPQGKWTQGIPV